MEELAGSNVAVLVDSAEALIAELSRGWPYVRVTGQLRELPAISLKPGQMIEGADDRTSLSFVRAGIGLSADNHLARLSLQTPADEPVVYLDAFYGDRGCLTLEDVDCAGLVEFVFGDETRSAALRVERIGLHRANAQDRAGPSFNGVKVVPGSLTIWNRSTQASRVTLDIEIDAIGDYGHPIVGSGILIAGGASASAGEIEIGTFRCGAIHCRSGLPPDTADRIAAGVMILRHVRAGAVEIDGSIMTQDANALPFDNWGEIDRCDVRGDLVSHGANSIGVLNGGSIGTLAVAGSIVTRGEGARGAALIGDVGEFIAGSIATHGAGAVGVQIVRQLEHLNVGTSLLTFGDVGRALVRGEFLEQPAHAIRIEPTGHLRRLSAPVVRTVGRNALQLSNAGQFG